MLPKTHIWKNYARFIIVLILSLALLAACGDATPTSAPATTAAATTISATTTSAVTSAAATTLAATTTSAVTTSAATTVATTAAPTGTTAAPQANATAAGANNFPPILFVHGNGDYSALWVSTIWRFEANGYPRDRLFALDYPNPNARDDDTVAQPNRSSTEEQRNQLSGFVDNILSKTGASKLILVAQSRGGNSVRNYLKNGGGAAKVEKAILAGTPNHGVSANLPPNNEFNGQGPFLKNLNSGPNEVVEGVPFLTLRSDSQDKFAQPGIVPGLGYDGPELKGAKNVVLPGTDHRETGYSPQAFAEMFQFITNRAPASVDITPEAAPKLTGLVTGYENRVPTNKGVEGVKVAIYEIDQTSGQRSGAAVYQATTDANGSWGNFTAKPTVYYEFVVQAPNQPIRHFFRTPFPRSTNYLHFRLFPDEPVAGKSVIYFTRPRGYISNTRDKHLLDNKPVPGVKDGVPTDASFRVELDGPERAVPVSLNKEAMTVRAIPGEVVYAEFTY